MKPKVYGYIRLSPSRNGKRDLRTQKEAIRAYFKLRIKATHEWAGWVSDEVTGEVPFANRPGGLKLTTLLERGDAVLFAKVDRGFRNFLDLVTTANKWEVMGYTAHFIDMNIDTSSEMGKMLLYLLGLFAEWERKRIRGRTKEAMAVRKANGRPVGRAPYGFKNVGPKGNRRFIPHPAQREAGKEIVRLRDVCGKPWNMISLMMQADGWTYRVNGKLGVFACRLYYEGEKQLQQEGK